MFRDEYIVQISEYLLARFFKDSLILNNAPKLQLFPSLQYHTSTYPFPISMNFLFSLSFNPLSLMKSTRLFRNFVFLFSLLGLGSFAWGERYETVFIYSEDTVEMDNSAARAYLQSNACVSTQSLTIPEGEVAYVFSSGAAAKPTGSASLTSNSKDAFVYGITIDTLGLDSNLTRKSWTMTFVDSEHIGNYTSSAPIAGPATIRILIKPWSGRLAGQYRQGERYWSWYNDNSDNRYDSTDWDFKASEGYITFRIVGSEQAPSKKFATVIPENASGNVRIVLEQSTDLINWSSANPGVFPPSTSKRFFRVRSVEE
jgi:hypothetical protein